MIDKLAKALINALMELGPVKAVLSRKAIITLAAVGAIYAWTKEAMAEGWPIWVVCVGMISVAIIAAAYVIVQGLVDKEVERGNTEIVKGENYKESGFVLVDIRFHAILWTVIGFLILLGLAFAHTGCRDEDSGTERVEDYAVTKYADAIVCFSDSVTQVPQLWGIYQVPSEFNNELFSTEIRIVGYVCSPVSEFREVNGEIRELIIGESCLRQVLDMEPAADTDCLAVTGGAQNDLDVFVYPLLWYPLELKAESFPPASAGVASYSLVRNEVPSLVGDDQKIYPDCAPYHANCFELGLECEELTLCCDDPTVRRNQEPGICTNVMP